MRLISTNAEFTWSGTLFIIGTFGIIGLLLGLAYASSANPAPRLPHAYRAAVGLAGIVLAGGVAGRR